MLNCIKYLRKEKHCCSACIFKPDDKAPGLDQVLRFYCLCKENHLDLGIDYVTGKTLFSNQPCERFNHRGRCKRFQKKGDTDVTER